MVYGPESFLITIFHHFDFIITEWHTERNQSAFNCYLGERLKHRYLSYIFHTLANFNKVNAWGMVVGC